jgi:hypothetical protein
MYTGFFLGGEADAEGQFGKPKRIWQDNIKMDFKEIECGGRGLD